MIRMNKEIFIKKCISFIEKEADITANYKKHNKIVDEHVKFLKDNSECDFFKEAVEELMNSNNIDVRFYAATYAVKYNINTKKAMKIIKRISRSFKYRNTNASLLAQMFLDMYSHSEDYK